MTLVEVRDASAAAAARAEARAAAARRGWPDEVGEELAICASELVMNVVDHAGASGTLAVVAAEDGTWVELGARDRGAGLDPARVGAPTTPGRGGGLPALGRLMDSTTLVLGDGLLVVARRWAPPRDTPRTRAPVRSAVVQRPRPGERVCGDAALVERRAGVTRLAVVDGLGHGPPAAAAAQACVRALAANLELSLEAAVLRAHAALAGTRGAALAAVDVDEVHRTATVIVVGNCRLEALGADGRRSVPGVEAVLGQPRPGGGRWPLRPEPLRLAPGAVLLLTSDGVSSRGGLERTSRADGLLVEACRRFAVHAGTTDDATLLLATLT